VEAITRFSSTLVGRLVLAAVLGLVAAAAVFAVVSSSLIRSQTAQATRRNFDQQAQRVAALIGAQTLEQAVTGSCQTYSSEDLSAFVGPGAHIYIDSPPLCPGGSQPLDNVPATTRLGINTSQLAREGFQHISFSDPTSKVALVATAAPITVDGQQIGVIVLTKPQSLIATSWSEVVPNLLFAALIGLIPAVLVTLIFTRRLTRPLRTMEHAAESVAAGDLTTSVPPAGTRELDHLAHAFNSMVDGLRERDARGRAFLMNVTHDLRTPLTAIRGHAGALRDGVVPADRIDHSLMAIESAATRLESMVADLLDLARIDAHQFRVHPTTTPIARVLEEAITAHQPLAALRRISLEASIEHDIPIVTDHERVRQILDNLLENALRWTPQDGTITGALTPLADGTVHISIADSGPGVAMSQRDQIFAPFHSEQTPDGRTGSGLGLAICRQLARILGGDITVTDAEGGGAAFILTLPASAPLDSDANHGGPSPHGESR